MRKSVWIPGGGGGGGVETANWSSTGTEQAGHPRESSGQIGRRWRGVGEESAGESGDRRRLCVRVREISVNAEFEQIP